MSERRDDLHVRGMETRRAVLGDEHVDRAIERTTPFTEDFQDLITRYAWGEIWTRPGLDRRTRSCITLTALVALNRPEELEMHLRAALRNGVTPEEIREVLLHCAVYCGVPAANGAFAIAKIDPDATPAAPGGKDETRDASADLVDELAGLQERLWAEDRRSVLVVFQAMDAGGKDGAIKKVFTGISMRRIFARSSSESCAAGQGGQPHSRMRPP